MIIDQAFDRGESTAIVPAAGEVLGTEAGHDQSEAEHSPADKFAARPGKGKGEQVIFGQDPISWASHGQNPWGPEITLFPPGGQGERGAE